MRSRRWAIAMSLVLLGLNLMVGCSAHPYKTGGPAELATLRPVTLMTDFGFNGRHAYYYVALDKGYYRAEQLDVTIQRGNGSAEAIRQVAAGQATVALADSGTLVLTRAKEHVPVKMVSVLYQRPMHAIYALEGSGIARPRDLEGKIIGGTAGSAVPALFPMYAQAAGFDHLKVAWMVADGSALGALLVTGKVQAVGMFTVDEPLLRKLAAPKQLIRLAYADEGIDLYGSGIVAADDTISTRPELLRAFLRATRRGMADAFADPFEAAVTMAKYHPEVDLEIARQELEIVKAAAGDGSGRIDAMRMQHTIEVVKQAFGVTMPLSAGEVSAPDLSRADGP